MEDFNSLQANGCYKNLKKHMICSKCNVASTQHNFLKRRTVCNSCYNNHVLAYYKNKLRSKCSPKSDVSTRTDFSNKQDSSNKRDNSNKPVRSSKQVSSNKQERSSKQVISKKTSYFH